MLFRAYQGFQNPLLQKRSSEHISGSARHSDERKRHCRPKQLLESYSPREEEHTAQAQKERDCDAHELDEHEPGHAPCAESFDAVFRADRCCVTLQLQCHDDELDSAASAQASKQAHHAGNPHAKPSTWTQSVSRSVHIFDHTDAPNRTAQYAQSRSLPKVRCDVPVRCCLCLTDLESWIVGTNANLQRRIKTPAETGRGARGEDACVLGGGMPQAGLCRPDRDCPRFAQCLCAKLCTLPPRHPCILGV